MSLPNAILNLECNPDTEREIVKALLNSGIKFNKESLSENNYKFYLPPYYSVISIVIQIIKSKVGALEGTFILPNGKTFDVTLEGIKEIEKDFVESIFKDREIVPVTPEEIVPTAKTIMDYTPEQWSGFLNTVGEVWTKIKTTGSAEKKYLAYPIYGLIALIFLGFLYLSIQKIIDGQSVTFIFGIIIGSLIPFLREFIIPEQA